MRSLTLAVVLTISLAAMAQAQKPTKPPVIFAPPITPDEAKPTAPNAAPVVTTIMPVNPADVDVKITEILITIMTKPFVLPTLPDAGSPRDDLKTVKLALGRKNLHFAENTIAEADAPDGGTGSSGRTEMLPAGFATLPDGHESYHANAMEQTTMLALTPKVQPDKLIQVDLKLSFTETVTTPRSGKSKPHDFHLPVHAVVTARAGDTLLVPTVENDKTMMRLLFATVTILAPNKE